MVFSPALKKCETWWFWPWEVVKKGGSGKKVLKNGGLTIENEGKRWLKWTQQTCSKSWWLIVQKQQEMVVQPNEYVKKDKHVENDALTIRSRRTRWFNPTRIVEHGSLTNWNSGNSWFIPTRIADNCGLSITNSEKWWFNLTKKWKWSLNQECGLNQWEIELGLKMVDLPKKIDYCVLEVVFSTIRFGSALFVRYIRGDLGVVLYRSKFWKSLVGKCAHCFIVKSLQWEAP